MGHDPRHYPDWKAPSQDGELLVWPAPSQLLADVSANFQRFSASQSVLLQNVSLPEMRSRMRAFIGHNDERPLIATGHQVELHHPGVWIKNAVIDAMARRLGGRALHVAVDTDAPKHSIMKWPSGTAPITDDAALAKAAWSGLVQPPTPVHIAGLQSQLELASATWNFKPVVLDVLASLRRLALEATDLPSSLTNAMHEMDWSLGLEYDVLLASPIWMSEPFLLFAHDLLARPDVHGRHYNAALAEYRAASGIQSSMRPMPDLLQSPGAVEVPFWLDNVRDGTRSRPSLFHSDRGWILELVSGEEFIFDPSADGWDSARRLQRWLTQTGHRLTPRALTLTLFLRIGLVDQFIHGIGGGRYDQVTDRLIELQYDMVPPAFGVATATLYFPGFEQRERVCLPCIKQQGHHQKHALLGSRKRELVAQIDSLPRNSAARSTAFFEMQAELQSQARQTGVIEHWQQKLADTEIREREEAIYFDRELFYALQPRDRLEALMARVKSQMA